MRLIHVRCAGQSCPEKCGKEWWNYATDNGWKIDNTLRIECGESKIHIIVENAETDITWLII